MDQRSTQFPSPASLAAHTHTIHDHHPNPHLVDHQHPHFDLRHHVPPIPPPGSAEQHFSIPTLPSHGNIGLGVLDGTDASVFHPHSHTQSLPHLQRLQDLPNIPILQQDLHQQHQLNAPPAATPPPPSESAPPSHVSHTQYGMLTPNPMAIVPNTTIAKLQQGEEYITSSGPLASPSTPESNESRPHGQLVYKIVANPPDLHAWREKLFNVDNTIILTNDEFETYFPHIDNVYSHRSTQRYKRKPFVSHYWDCRMKGRPPGTPKSDDPSKKKRKRQARERDLCDVKIKITEYFPGATLQPDDGTDLSPPGSNAYPSPQHHNYSAEGLMIQPGASGEKFWTIQRVNGNGGNGKGDGVAGPHKHTLERSDEIKKSTVQRFRSAQERETRKTQKPLQRRISGPAQGTARKHAKDHELKLYAACFWYVNPLMTRMPIRLDI
jgi:glutathione S-transferase